MYKRKQKPPPSFLSLTKSSRSDKNNVPVSISDATIEENDENNQDHGNAPSDATAADVDAEAQFLIPASQQTSQRRYFSQRSNMNRSQITTQQTSTSRKVPSSYFENTLLRCGVIFENPQYFIIGCDHINFVNKLRSMLRSAPDYPGNVDKFLSGLRDYIKEEHQMTKVLTVCMINIPNCDFLPQSQDCLVRNFLMIDFMEPKIVELLLEQLKTVSSTDNPTDQNICSAILILTQLSFVNKIANSDVIFNQILDILRSTEDAFRNEIIKFLPEILDTKKHDKVVENIMTTMGSDSSKYLNEVTVNSFEAMQLSPNLRTELKVKILAYIQEGNASIKLYASFTKFILNCDKSENHMELITRFRKALNWRNVDEAERRFVNEAQKIVFEFILRSLKRSKELNEAWLKSILNASRAEEIYTIDIIIIILMSAINEDKSLYLENVLKRKIKCGWITRDMFKEAVTGYPLVISQHLKVFFEFIENLFRVKDELFEFGEIGYKLAFGIPNCDHKLLLSKLIAFVCEKNSDFVVRRALMLLQEISVDHPEEVQKYSLQVLRVLDKINDVGLFEHRLIMNLLSSIAYPPPPALPIDGIASHIDILVRKQVSAPVINIKRQGIVGSVRVIDHLIWHNDEQSAAENDRDTDATIETLDDLPDGNAKTAGNVVTLMLLSAENLPYNRALCFDELSAALCPRMLNMKTHKHLNKPFLNWCSEIVTQEFQSKFVVDDIPDIPGFHLDRQFGLNREDEYGSENTEAALIAINIAGLVLNEEYKSKPVICTLSPIFNLMRIMHFHRNNGDLESINAVLGCPVIFPHFDNSPEDLVLFDESESEKNTLILDAFFYTANWFREVICAFSSQRELNIRSKVLLRLSNLISMEQTIKSMLTLLPPTYDPPKCHFMTLETNPMAIKKAKPAKEAKEKKKPNESIPNNSTLMANRTQNNTLANLLQTTKGDDKKGHSSGFYGPKEVYRQLDPDVMLLLQESLCTIYPLPKEKLGACLGLAEYKFILEDLILKLESVTGMKKSAGFQQEQFIISPIALIYDIKQFLPRFMHFFEQISSAIQKDQELGKEQSTDHFLYNDEMGQLKMCLGLTLRLLAAFFSWQGFHQEKHEELFKKSLLIVLGKDSIKEPSITNLCARVVDAMLAKQTVILDLYSAVHLYQMAEVLSDYTKDFQKSVNICEKFLGQPWNSMTGSVEKGCEANILLDQLLKGLFKDTNYKITHKHILKTLAEVASLNSKDGKLNSYPNFTKSNFAILFRALSNSLFEYTMDRLEKDMTTLGKLDFWENVYEDMNNLLDMVKLVNIPRNFSLFLKYSHLTLKLFLQHGIPMVESSLKSRPERVYSLLKSLQITTRFLHTLCCHSKAVRNAGIIAQIPGLRQTVESFNYSVKGALAANKCSSAFWMGNLKNKDMQGEEILSQVISLSDGPGDSEERFPSDDETVEGSYLGITTMCHSVQPVAVAGPSRRTTRARK